MGVGRRVLRRQLQERGPDPKQCRFRLGRREGDVTLFLKAKVIAYIGDKFKMKAKHNFKVTSEFLLETL